MSNIEVVLTGERAAFSHGDNEEKSKDQSQAAEHRGFVAGHVLIN